MIAEDNGKFWEEYNFACRNFKVEDRVQTFFGGKWYKGKVINKKIRENRCPYILIKTDEKVEDGELLDGYGIRGPVDGRDPTFFEREPLPEGDEIYQRIIKRYLTRKEIRKYKKEEEEWECPF